MLISFMLKAYRIL